MSRGGERLAAAPTPGNPRVVTVDASPDADGPLSPLSGLLQSLGLDAVAPRTVGHPVTFTVITRTQGRRPGALREALDSLAAQSWPDFEVIVTVHGDTSEAARVEDAVSGAAALSRCRVMHVPAGGSRSRPLNAGIGAAEGDYVAFLDDDDLAEPQWLEVFARGAAQAPGQIIRARTARQPWVTDGTGEPRRPGGPIEHVYPASFDLLAHFAYSETPICSVALPRRGLERFGLRFDEDLTVCEDWDLIVRGALVLGVCCMDETTSLYRRSNNANSLSDADRLEWHTNRARVIDKLAAGPFVLDGAAARRIADAHFDYEGGPGGRVELVNTRDLIAALPRRLVARLLRQRRRGGATPR